MKSDDTIASRTRQLPSTIAELWSSRDCSQHFGRSLKTINYVVRSRGIKAVARRGAKKLFDLPGVELIALGLAEIESISGLADRLDRLEAAEASIEAGERSTRAQMATAGKLEARELVKVVRLRGLQKEAVKRARAIIEGTDKRINLTQIA